MNELDQLKKDIEEDVLKILTTYDKVTSEDRIRNICNFIYDKYAKGSYAPKVGQPYAPRKSWLKTIKYCNGKYVIENGKQFPSIRTAKTWIKRNYLTLFVDVKCQLAGIIKEVFIEMEIKY